MNFKMNKLIITLAAILLVSGNLLAQSEVEMADGMRASGKIYVVVAIALLIFAGIVIYLFTIDRKVTRLEKAQREKKG